MTRNPQPNIIKMHLESGESCYISKDGTIYPKGSPEGDYYAKEDTIVAGRDGPILEADSIGCAVITLYNPKTKIGLIIHIAAEHLVDEYHINLIYAATELIEGFNPGDATFSLFIDDTSYVSELRTPDEIWPKRIEAKLRSLGYREGIIITEGNEGKYVRLNTATGRILVFESGDTLIYDRQAS